MWLILFFLSPQLTPQSHANFLSGVLADYFPRSDAESGAWYQSQVQPDFQLSDVLLPYFWVTAFGLMSLSGLLIWRRTLRYSSVGPTLAYFAVQAILCLLWVGTFYGLNSIWASVVISFFWTAMALATYFAFLRYAMAAAFAFLPYLFWVFYLTYFSVSLMILNM